VSYRVVINSEARADLFQLYSYIASQGYPDRAFKYICRIEEFCLGLGTFPLRGQRADHLRPGMRIVSFERRVEIAFEVTTDAVVIFRVLYGGRDLEKMFLED
jgi:toxin ParE1/3/4